MKRVKIVRTIQGSPNGVNVITYRAGGIYEFTNEELANTFISIGAAEEAVEEAVEEKDAGGAPSNKAVGAPPADSTRRRRT